MTSMKSGSPMSGPSVKQLEYITPSRETSITVLVRRSTEDKKISHVVYRPFVIVGRNPLCTRCETRYMPYLQWGSNNWFHSHDFQIFHGNISFMILLNKNSIPFATTISHQEVRFHKFTQVFRKEEFCPWCTDCVVRKGIWHLLWSGSTRLVIFMLTTTYALPRSTCHQVCSPTPPVGWAQWPAKMSGLWFPSTARLATNSRWVPGPCVAGFKKAWFPVRIRILLMTTSNGCIFRVTDPLYGEFTGDRWIPSQSPVTRSFDVFFDLRLNKRLSKQS